LNVLKFAYKSCELLIKDNNCSVEIILPIV
jgi:hypothetical protein